MRSIDNQVRRHFEENQNTLLGIQIKELFEKEGMETFEKVRKAILGEQIECQELRDALEYFLSYKRTGFFVRPTLISLGCEAVGGRLEEISDIAVPLVLMSGGMDIHDDILDNQKTQDSRHTVLGKFGNDIALLAGDALLFKGLTCWHKLITKRFSTKQSAELTLLLEKAFVQLGDGQALEISLKGQTNVTSKNYFHIVEKKAADIEAILRFGAIIGNATREKINALGSYGRCVGMLWILANDVADMFNHQEMKRRMKNECLPLPLLYAIENPEVKSKLQKILMKRKITEKDTDSVFRMVQKAAGLEKTKKIMQDLIFKALRNIERFRNSEKLKLLVIDSQNFISQI